MSFLSSQLDGPGSDTRFISDEMARIAASSLLACLKPYQNDPDSEVKQTARDLSRCLNRRTAPSTVFPAKNRILASSTHNPSEVSGKRLHLTKTDGQLWMTGVAARWLHDQERASGNATVVAAPFDLSQYEQTVQSTLSSQHSWVDGKPPPEVPKVVSRPVANKLKVEEQQIMNMETFIMSTPEGTFGPQDSSGKSPRTEYSTALKHWFALTGSRPGYHRDKPDTCRHRNALSKSRFAPWKNLSEIPITRSAGARSRKNQKGGLNVGQVFGHLSRAAVLSHLSHASGHSIIDDGLRAFLSESALVTHAWTDEPTPKPSGLKGSYWIRPSALTDDNAEPYELWCFGDDARPSRQRSMTVKQVDAVFKQ